MSRVLFPKHLKREVSAWRVMRRRCLEPTFKDFWRYGGAGITIHPPWLSSFEAFLQDVGPAPSPRHWLGRTDVKGNYEPGNVAWRTPKAQMRQKPTTHKVPINMTKATLGEISAMVGVSTKTLWNRLFLDRRPMREAVSKSPIVPKNRILIVHLGIAKTLGQWAKLSGVDPQLLWRRLKAGWPPALALDPTPRKAGKAQEQLKAALRKGQPT